MWGPHLRKMKYWMMIYIMRMGMMYQAPGREGVVRAVSSLPVLTTPLPASLRGPTLQMG